MDTKAAAAALAVSTETLVRYVKEGRLPAVRILPKGPYRFRASDIQHLIDESVAPPWAEGDT